MDSFGSWLGGDDDPCCCGPSTIILKTPELVEQERKEEITRNRKNLLRYYKLKRRKKEGLKKAKSNPNRVFCKDCKYYHKEWGSSYPECTLEGIGLYPKLQWLKEWYREKGLDCDVMGGVSSIARHFFCNIDGDCKFFKQHISILQQIKNILK